MLFFRLPPPQVRPQVEQPPLTVPMFPLVTPLSPYTLSWPGHAGSSSHTQPAAAPSSAGSKSGSAGIQVRLHEETILLLFSASGCSFVFLKFCIRSDVLLVTALMNWCSSESIGNFRTVRAAGGGSGAAVVEVDGESSTVRRCTSPGGGAAPHLSLTCSGPLSSL